jgi:integrase/recombinase XerC
MNYLIDFLNFLRYEKHYSSYTINSYRIDLTQCNDFLSVNVRKTIEEANHIDLQLWIRTLVENNIKASSIQRKISSLKSFYKYLIKKGEIKSDPSRKLIMPKKEKRLPTYVEEKNILELFDKIEFSDDFESQRDKLVLSLLFATGIRLSELINIKIGDIDISSCTLKVLGKRKKERIIPFGKILQKDILNYLKVRPVADVPYLIITDKFKQAYPKLIYRIVRKYINMVSTIEKKSPHVLRHTFATILLNHGADLNAIKELLGHSNLAATQIYTHNSFERLKDIYRKSHPRM